ncbi:MAG: hypothetical protein R6T78_01845 [Dehalococcoidales bacterium]
MSYPDSLILLVMGIAFLSAGVGTFFKGKYDEKREYDTLTSRTDMKEFIEHSPEQSKSGSLKLGGRIAIIIGLVLLGIVGGLQLWA